MRLATACLVLVLALLALAGCVRERSPGEATPTAGTVPLTPGQTGQVLPTRVATPARETAMTITVRVPSNTPEEDAIYLHSGPFVSIPMERAGENLWSVTLTEADFADPLGGGGPDYRGASYDFGNKTLSYTYSRAPSEWGNHAAEDIADAPGIPFWAMARTLTFEPGTERRDAVARWKWFPPDGEALPVYEPELTDWLPRIEGWEFMAGELEADVWHKGQAQLVGPTNEHAKRMNVEWV
ncbi:MAG: hypothetical protein FJ317_04370, partial [SAR202 cluster bacterium]|nr:hypothetical protein [SAR202 cluster bacterium]